jgi:DeoR family suf operon transcriptional repressor
VTELEARPRKTLGSSKDEILNHLHHQGRATVREIATLLGVTPAAVRQHAGVLEREGLVTASQVRGKVGRPALVYALTPLGESRFPANYAMLVNLLLEEVRTMAGAEALQQLLRRVSGRMAERYADRVLGRSAAQRVAAAAEVLREQGCDVAVEQRAGEYFIEQCTCPYPEVARLHSAVCAMEVDFVQRMTGADARLVGSLLRGDPACSYRIRPTNARPSSGSVRRV